jgi:hypothetical protein
LLTHIPHHPHCPFYGWKMRMREGRARDACHISSYTELTSASDVTEPVVSEAELKSLSLVPRSMLINSPFRMTQIFWSYYTNDFILIWFEWKCCWADVYSWLTHSDQADCGCVETLHLHCGLALFNWKLLPSLGAINTSK